MRRLALAAARAAAATLSPAGKRARLSILIFHRVRPERDALFPGEDTAESFSRRLDLLGATYHMLPLPEALQRLREGTLPSRPACITFDDGYRDNADVALPLLLRRGMHATFFVASGFLDGGRMWNDTLIESVRHARGPLLDLRELGLGRAGIGTDRERGAAAEQLIRALKHLAPAERALKVDAVAAACNASLPRDLMMTSDQVRLLAQSGMEIGGHTVTHPILTRLPTDEARAEIEQGASRLRDITGRPVRLFAYPNGKPGSDYAPEHAALARDAGFEAALSTRPGVATARSDLFHLPRFTPWDPTDARFIGRSIANLRNAD